MSTPSVVSPVSSDARRPVAYITSRMARSRRPTGALTSGAARSASTWRGRQVARQGLEGPRAGAGSPWGRARRGPRAARSGRRPAPRRRGGPGSAARGPARAASRRSRRGGPGRARGAARPRASREGHELAEVALVGRRACSSARPRSTRRWSSQAGERPGAAVTPVAHPPLADHAPEDVGLPHPQRVRQQEVGAHADRDRHEAGHELRAQAARADEPLEARGGEPGEGPHDGGRRGHPRDRPEEAVAEQPADAPLEEPDQQARVHQRAERRAERDRAKAQGSVEERGPRRGSSPPRRRSRARGTRGRPSA